MRELVLGTIFFLFVACFVAIVIENAFLGGRRRRRLVREAQLKQRIAENKRKSGSDPKTN